MKLFFIALWLLPMALWAQDCSLNKEKDPFSQELKLSTGFLPISAGLDRVLISADADSREINILFSLKSNGDARCFDDASTAIIAFDGKIKSTFRNSGAMNCEGIFQLTFRNSATTPSLLQRLATKKISAISLTGSKITNITLQEEEKQLLMERIACLVNEAKTLLKK